MVVSMLLVDMQPSAHIRSAVRSDKGLPIIIDMLSPSHHTLDVIARTAAICLRNLAIDAKNKELIGNESSSIKPDLTV